MTKTKKDKIKENIIAILVGVLLAMLLNKFVVKLGDVTSGSMENTIIPNSKIVINLLSYKLNEPERGDIMVFYAPDKPDTYYVKRVIGLPGDTIEGINGEVYINNNKIKENYIKEKLNIDFGPYTVPENSYFMLGDNRNNSLDSRYWVNTYVTEDKIIGKAIASIGKTNKIFDKVEYEQ